MLEHGELLVLDALDLRKGKSVKTIYKEINAQGSLSYCKIKTALKSLKVEKLAGRNDIGWIAL